MIDQGISFDLSEDNIDAVAMAIRERLVGKTFAIATSRYCNGGNAELDLNTDCVLHSEWTSKPENEPVRVFHDGEYKWLSFSAGHYLWGFHPREDCPDSFMFGHDEFTVTIKSAAGHVHKHKFRVQTLGGC